MRIHTVSDIHADYPENFEWVLRLSKQDYQNDVLILPGDVSDDLNLLSRVLDAFKQSFSEVFFVPGNHELWVGRDQHNCSLTKFEEVLNLCKEHGVHTMPLTLNKVTIVPLFSWYDFSFGEPGKYLMRAWRDFRACQWPEHLADAQEISNYFHSLNSDRLLLQNDKVISFSHFLPRIDVMPARIPEDRRKVYPVLGGETLGRQVQQLNPDVHIYGHSHVNQDITIDGIQYINNAFAYPSEDRISRKCLHCVLDTPTSERNPLLNGAA